MNTQANEMPKEMYGANTEPHTDNFMVTRWKEELRKDPTFAYLADLADNHSAFRHASNIGFYSTHPWSEKDVGRKLVACAAPVTQGCDMLVIELMLTRVDGAAQAEFMIDAAYELEMGEDGMKCTYTYCPFSAVERFTVKATDIITDTQLNNLHAFMGDFEYDDRLALYSALHKWAFQLR